MDTPRGRRGMMRGARRTPDAFPRVRALERGRTRARARRPSRAGRPHGGGRWPGDDGSGVVDGAGVVGVKVGQHRHDAVAQAMGRGEYAVVANGVGAAGRDQRGKATAQRRAVGDPGSAAGRVGTGEAVLDTPVGAQHDAVGGHGGAQKLAGEPLERGGVGRTGGGVGVERETVEERAAAAGSTGVGRGLGERLGLHGLGDGVGERVQLGVVGESGVAAAEDARGTPDDARGESLDVVVGRRRQAVEADGEVGLLLPHAVGDQGMEGRGWH